MLKAKIKEKLLNRRDEVEVESLDGDIVINGNIKANNVNNVVVVSNIKQISGDILSSLKAGDVVLKQDSSGYHAYNVSFKKDGTGVCLTYTDASLIETQSYDYTGGSWVYNSEDKMPLVDVENALDGTIDKALGLNAQGKLVKGSVSGGTKFYKHYIYSNNDDDYFEIINTNSEPYTEAIVIINGFVYGIVSKDSTGYPILSMVYSSANKISIATCTVDPTQQTTSIVYGEFDLSGGFTDTVTPL